ncbi:hypothetical protein EX30DRAFT_295497, partial [Ascodesmis nigricans]
VPKHVPIPESLYTAFLDVRVPITIAVVYAITIHLLNARANGTPYRIANTRIFKAFVIAHNIFLAVYSAWTFYGMVTGIHRTLDRSSGIAGAVTSMCKIRSETRVPFYSGAGGNATVPVTTTETLAAGKATGLWEEALAYYGWWFYLSKFYEVIDTAIIILKGKKSSLLQTYHHAGAMICMWFGIRYMAPPIWIFCVFNSLIHALMYTYYSLTALKIRVPNVLKRSLTSMQITQFLIGGSLAASYLFVALADGVPCLSNTGEAWAVVANVAYLAPLTYLFVDFFIRSYTGKGKSTK